MSSDYTPTTEDVRVRYALDRGAAVQRPYFPALADFDRWLAAERARVWDEAMEATAAAVWAESPGTFKPPWTWIEPTNPYKETP